MTEAATIPTNKRRPYPVGRLLDGKARAVLFDAARCIGCRHCVEGCKDWNDLPRGNSHALGSSTWIAVGPPVMEGQSSIWGRISCMHCESPLCAAVCPVEAITKYEEGPVVIDQELCIGCEYCIYACPWHVISRSETGGKSVKCTMCLHRIAAGAPPFCVQICPNQALFFGIVEDMLAQAEEKIRQKGASIYGDRQAGGTHVLHVLAKSPGEHGLLPVGTERYPRHHIPFGKKVAGLLSATGGAAGKWRAITNAMTKPWRLKYRYWHRPG